MSQATRLQYLARLDASLTELDRAKREITDPAHDRIIAAVEHLIDAVAVLASVVLDKEKP